jgi:hypothetical protein
MADAKRHAGTPHPATQHAATQPNATRNMNEQERAELQARGGGGEILPQDIQVQQSAYQVMPNGQTAQSPSEEEQRARGLSDDGRTITPSAGVKEPEEERQANRRSEEAQREGQAKRT